MSATAAQVQAAELLAATVAGRFPDDRGRFGPFGGRYVPETLIPALERLEHGGRDRRRHARDRIGPSLRATARRQDHEHRTERKPHVE